MSNVKRKFIDGQGAQKFIDGQGAQKFIDGQGAQKFIDGQGAQKFIDGQGAQKFTDGQGAQKFTDGQAMDRFVDGKKSETKIFEVPLVFGYGCGDQPAEIPKGYFTGKNVMPNSADGSWRTRISYDYYGDNLTGTIRDIHAYADGMLYVNSAGAAYYYSGGWNACTWQGVGSAPAIPKSGSWAECGDMVIFTCEGISPLKFYGTNQEDYDYLSGAALGYGDVVCEHQNRILINYGLKIMYSDLGDPDTVASNEVNVGGGYEKINGLWNLNGNLYVGKTGGLWIKTGLYSEMISTMFQQVISSKSTFRNVGVVAGGSLFFANISGVYQVSANQAVNISGDFASKWRTLESSQVEVIKMGFLRKRQWLIVSTGPSYNETFLYDLTVGEWYRWYGLKFLCMSSSTSGSGTYSGLSGKAKICRWTGKESLEDGEETSIAVEIQTPFLDMNNVFADKLLKAIYVYGKNILKVEVYLRNEPSGAGSLACSITGSNVRSKMSVSPNKVFREISVKITGKTGATMILKGIAVEYKEMKL